MGSHIDITEFTILSVDYKECTKLMDIGKTNGGGQSSVLITDQLPNSITYVAINEYFALNKAPPII